MGESLTSAERCRMQVRHRAARVDAQPLADVVASLRAPDGCAWDRAQTHESLIPFLMEESWELAEAIESGDADLVREELGDVLLQVVLHAQLADEAGTFSLQNVCDTIEAKMIERHPHVFDAACELSPEEVEAAWTAAKAQRRQGKSLLYGIPARMPALQRAEKLTARAATVGFDWETASQVMLKVHEEVGELQQALDSGDREHTIDEAGDVLFAVVNLLRKLGVASDVALHRTNDRFSSRFRHMEEIVAGDSRSLADLSLDELESLWVSAKQIERGQAELKGE